MNRRNPMATIVAAGLMSLGGWAACSADPIDEVAPTDETAEAPVSTVASLPQEVFAPIRVRATPAGNLAPRPPIEAEIPEFLDDEEFPIGSHGVPGFDLSWNTFDGGGITFASGGAFQLAGTIGQPDTDYLVGGGYTLAGGFFGRVAAPADCPGDANNDNVVNFADITAILANWLDFGALGDANNDWVVNFLDVTTVLANWGATCP